MSVLLILRRDSPATSPTACSRSGAPPTPDLAIEQAKATRAELEAQKIQRDQVKRTLEKGEEVKA